LPVPSHHCFGLDDEQSITPARPHAGGNYPEQPVFDLNLWSLLATFQYNQLLAKCQVLGREMRDNIKLIACPIQGFENDSEHH
jgi:hypothetical protein